MLAAEPNTSQPSDAAGQKAAREGQTAGRQVGEQLWPGRRRPARRLSAQVNEINDRFNGSQMGCRRAKFTAWPAQVGERADGWALNLYGISVRSGRGAGASAWAQAEGALGAGGKEAALEGRLITMRRPRGQVSAKMVGAAHGPAGRHIWRPTRAGSMTNWLRALHCSVQFNSGAKSRRRRRRRRFSLARLVSGRAWRVTRADKTIDRFVACLEPASRPAGLAPLARAPPPPNGPRRSLGVL